MTFSSRSFSRAIAALTLLTSGSAFAQPTPPTIRAPGLKGMPGLKNGLPGKVKIPPASGSGMPVVEEGPRPPEPIPGQEPNGKRVLPRNAVMSQGKFKLSFDKVDIEELVKQVADMTGKMFILPENIRGKITVIGPAHGEQFVSADEVYAAFLSALDANGLAVFPSGRFLRILEKRTAKNSNIPTFVEDGPYPFNEQMITRLFRIKNVDAEPIRGVVGNLVTQNGDASVFPPDLLIVNDQALNMHRLEKIIGQLDQPSTTDGIHVIQVQHAAANDLVDKINKIFELKKGQPGQRPGQAVVAVPKPAAGQELPAQSGGDDSNGPTALRLVLADERTNKLIVICNDRSFERVQTILKELDLPTSGEGGVHVYYLQNAAAEELSNTLSNLAQGSANKQKGGNNQQKNAAAELFAGEVKITAEKGTNSLVIIASDPDYRNLVKVIEKLDLARREVFVEAVIMEVNLDRQNTFGARVHSGVPPISTELFGAKGDAVSVIGTKFGNETLPPSFSLGSLASFGGFLAGIQGPVIPELSKLGLNVPSFGVVLNALQASSDVNVLSTPHILTTDNEEAEITVGQNVPFQSGFSAGGLGQGLSGLSGLAGGTTASSALGALGSLGSLGSAFGTIQRQNVELKLKIKPQINEGDLIRMVVDQQTEEIASQDPVLGPTTSKRSAKTTIIVRDQQTVVIGGMTQERTIDSVNKVPVLGDVPILGHLFRQQSRKKLRTNLLLFLTPYIIRDQSDFQRIFQRKLQERQQFVERFYGADNRYEAFIDYERKAGPLARMRQQLVVDADKIENGGSGRFQSEKAIVPSGRVNSTTDAPPSGRTRPEGGPPGSPPPPPTINPETLKPLLKAMPPPNLPMPAESGGGGGGGGGE